MKYIRDLSGIQTPQITNEPIAVATNIAKGAVVSVSAGLTIAATNSLATKISGVTATGHNGVNGTLTGWNYKDTVRVYSSPTAVFAYPAPVITATTNSTTNLVEASAVADFAAANAMQGGYLELKSLATGSAVTDSVGTKKLITASVNATKQFTVAFTGAVNIGDTFYCYPPKGFYKGEFSSDGTAMVLTATTNGPLAVVDWDFDKKEVHVMARLHQRGNQDA
jgi:hypothetical protein